VSRHSKIQGGEPERARVHQMSSPTIPRHVHINITHVGTGVAAPMLLVAEQTMLKSHSQYGHYAGICPVRLPSRKLAWPLAEIEKLLNGDREAE
jgi:hypothetical protein